MTMPEAAGIAARARVSRLLISHIFHDRDYSSQMAAAKKAFSRQIEIAEVSKTYTV